MIPVLQYIYRGQVEQLVGDDGRCRIRIFGIYDDIPTNQLPVAEPALGLFGATKTVAAGTLPEIGMWLFLFFDGGNIQSPVYFAYAPEGSKTSKSIMSNPSIDLSNAESALITLPGGCTLLISDGNVKLECAGSIIIKGQSILLN